MTETPNSPYQVGGALLQSAPSYVTRDSDENLYRTLKAGGFCYVLNCRQMGKSSLMVRTLARLQAEGWWGIILDFSAKDSNSDHPDRWYDGITNQLNNIFKLLPRADFRGWLKERDYLSPVERLGEFIDTVLLARSAGSIVVFVDEIDSTLGLPFTDDFFALIRACYNKRAENPDYLRLSFVLFGVAAPSDLIGDAKRTPFNIGTSIDLRGFTLEEAYPLEKGLTKKSANPRAVLREILRWTGGQPFLSQRLCQLVAETEVFIAGGEEASVIEGLVRSRIIDQWESRDQQEHLKTIRKRLLDDEQKAGYLLELYRTVLRDGEALASETAEERALQLTGLVVKEKGKLRVYNPIYATVFQESWIDAELGKLRPYAESFRAWVASGREDESRLLRGQALRDAEEWGAGKNLSYEDKQFLAAGRKREIEEEIANKDKEAELERERKDKEAAEQARQILEKANKGLRRRASIGTAILAITLLGAGFFAWQVKKQNEMLKAVRSLTQLAGELRKKGEVQASDEALRKVGLSTLIENEEVRRVWLDTAKEEADNAYRSGNRISIFKPSGNLSLESINRIQAQQVRAWTNFKLGKYQEAYDALKESNFNPYNINAKIDILTEKDVEVIHYQLIKSKNIDINSSDPVAESFRKHLYKGLEFLLKEDRLKEADRKTSEIMLYIAKRWEEDLLEIPDLQNFSCDALQKIDRLWYAYPKLPGRFGFRVQREIWQKNGSPTLDSPNETWINFWKEVGWMEETGRWKSYDNLPAWRGEDGGDSTYIPMGNLPVIRGVGIPRVWWEERKVRSFSRVVTCKI